MPKRDMNRDKLSSDQHAQTHDVRREAHTNPKGQQPPGEDFTADLAPQTSGQSAGHTAESRTAVDDKRVHQRLPELGNEELARLRVLEPGTQLHQGSIYLDLNDLARGPFQALGAQTAGADNRYVAKRDTDYDLWNRLVGDDREAEVERPAGVEA